ncbi:hypothetical protein GQ600_26724 [Phytophthora cactorum]|nr:hypothetical protein GQ600_26724 [Phytophthora cactorum]
MGVPLVGCASHRLNLADQGLFSQASDDLDQVKKLMTSSKVSTSRRNSDSVASGAKPSDALELDFCHGVPLLSPFEFINDDDTLAISCLVSPPADVCATACVKVLADKADELTRGEATSLRPFVVEDAVIETHRGTGEAAVICRAIEEARKLATRASTRYQPISAIPPTSTTWSTY